jgi:hypothetical protein
MDLLRDSIRKIEAMIVEGQKVSNRRRYPIPRIS